MHFTMTCTKLLPNIRTRDSASGADGENETPKRCGKKIQRDFMKLVWSQETDMSNQSKTFAIKAFEQVRERIRKWKDTTGYLRR